MAPQERYSRQPHPMASSLPEHTTVASAAPAATNGCKKPRSMETWLAEAIFVPLSAMLRTRERTTVRCLEGCSVESKCGNLPSAKIRSSWKFCRGCELV
jgi:hypothetical protein